MLSQLILGQEKAAVAGVTSGILALLAQVGVNGNLTVRDGVTSVVLWLITHAAVYFTKNTNLPKAEPSPSTPPPEAPAQGAESVGDNTPPAPQP